MIDKANQPQKIPWLVKSLNRFASVRVGCKRHEQTRLFELNKKPRTMGTSVAERFNQETGLTARQRRAHRYREQQPMLI
jgi:hypothetical protein